jgi:hypothetical protein
MCSSVLLGIPKQNLLVNCSMPCRHREQHLWKLGPTGFPQLQRSEALFVNWMLPLSMKTSSQFYREATVQTALCAWRKNSSEPGQSLEQPNIELSCAAASDLKNHSKGTHTNEEQPKATTPTICYMDPLLRSCQRYGNLRSDSFHVFGL